MGRNILVVEDDKNISDLIHMYLVKEGFDVRIAGDGGKALEEFQKKEPDLILLDIMLPVMDGWAVCAKIRETSKVPIIMLTAKSDVGDRITGLEMGADDYLVKPFEMNVLVAKIQALLRRSYDFSASGSDIREHNGMIFNSAACTAEYEGKIVELSRNENRILALLMEHKGRTVSREIIMNRLWESDAFIDENTLSVNINRLRKALASIGVTDLIETKKGIGYIIK